MSHKTARRDSQWLPWCADQSKECGKEIVMMGFGSKRAVSSTLCAAFLVAVALLLSGGTASARGIRMVKATGFMYLPGPVIIDGVERLQVWNGSAWQKVAGDRRFRARDLAVYSDGAYDYVFYTDYLNSSTNRVNLTTNTSDNITYPNTVFTKIVVNSGFVLALGVDGYIYKMRCNGASSEWAKWTDFRLKYLASDGYGLWALTADSASAVFSHELLAYFPSGSLNNWAYWGLPPSGTKFTNGLQYWYGGGAFAVTGATNNPIYRNGGSGTWQNWTPTGVVYDMSLSYEGYMYVLHLPVQSDGAYTLYRNSIPPTGWGAYPYPS
jgi:hypothetical protein